MEKNQTKFHFIILLLILSIHIPKSTTREVDNYIMEVFDSQYYAKGQFATNGNGDIVIEYSQGDNRLFYGIKKNGEGFFDGQYIKEIYLESSNLYESKNIFVSLNNTNNNNQYLFSFGSYESSTELHNLKDNSYITDTTENVLGNKVDSYINSLLDLNNGNNIYCRTNLLPTKNHFY